MTPGEKPPYEIEFYADASGDMPALRWIKEDLSPTKRRAVGAAMHEVLQRHGVQVVGERSWGRQLGQGVFEFRVDRSAKPEGTIAEKLALRVFCHAHGDRKILVLHGYDKGASPSSRRQQREIEAARTRLTAWRAARAKTRKQAAAVRKREKGPKGRGRG